MQNFQLSPLEELIFSSKFNRQVGPNILVILRDYNAN